MKVTIYQVISSSYETADNFLHQESYMFADKDKAREKFENLRDCIKGDVFGDDEDEVKWAAEDDDSENRYEASREVGTDCEYQAIVELKETEFEI